jgi:hypothetical protein
LLVPGLLQTPEYARALFRAWRTDDDQAKVEQLVLARMDRQRIFDSPKPPSFWPVLDEGVLRRHIGGAKVMHDQLVHLADMGERASIKIQVIPGGASVLVRDTKDRQGPVLRFTPGAWQRFADRLRLGAR